MCALDGLRSPLPPWLYVSTGLQLPVVQEAAQRVRTLGGSRMRTKEALLDEFELRLDLPGWFGHNWDALEDCLRGLDERDGLGLVLIITEADSVLADADSSELRTLLEILRTTGREWAEAKTLVGGGLPATPFNVVFVASGEAGPSSLARRCAAGGLGLAPLDPP